VLRIPHYCKEYSPIAFDFLRLLLRNLDHRSSGWTLYAIFETTQLMSVVLTVFLVTVTCIRNCPQTMTESMLIALWAKCQLTTVVIRYPPTANVGLVKVREKNERLWCPKWRRCAGNEWDRGKKATIEQMSHQAFPTNSQWRLQRSVPQPGSSDWKSSVAIWLKETAYLVAVDWILKK